jgi:CHAD domain-containing protein
VDGGAPVATTTDQDIRAGTGSKPADQAKLVHDTRKAIKRMRALARLLRGVIGEREFQSVNSRLRDTARRLAPSRDSAVRLSTLLRLIALHPKALALEGIERLRAQLEAELTQANPPVCDPRMLSDIAEMRRELSHWNVLDHDLGALTPGLRRIYGEGHRRYARAKRKNARPQDRHDWRKRVKALYYTLDMLGGESAKGTHGVTRRTERLGETLGEEHDLWVLSVYVEEHPQALAQSDRSQKVLLKLISKRRKRLGKRALADGAQIYADPPDKFTRRITHALSR